MKSTRVILGLLVIIFFALPILFGVIWAVGMTRAVTSTTLLADVPRQVIERVPGIVDEILTAADRDEIEMDSNSRAWLRAAAAVSVKPHVVLEKSGILAWLQKEISGKLAIVSEILRGRRSPQQVYVDFRPLKQALENDIFTDYFGQILQQLPACDQAQTETWQVTVGEGNEHEPLPPCRPSPEISAQVIQRMRHQMQWDIPDEVDIFHGYEYMPRGMNIAQTITSFSYLLFLVPALFILLGSLIAAASRSQFFKWCGFTTLAGGLLALLLALFTEKITDWAFRVTPMSSFHYHSPFEHVWLRQTGELVLTILRSLFSPVQGVAEVVCLIGVLLIACSYLMHDSATGKVSPSGKAS